MIHARAKRGETERAEHWLAKMLEAGVEPNIVAWPSHWPDPSGLGDSFWLAGHALRKNAFVLEDIP